MSFMVTDDDLLCFCATIPFLSLVHVLADGCASQTGRAKVSSAERAAKNKAASFCGAINILAGSQESSRHQASMVQVVSVFPFEYCSAVYIDNEKLVNVFIKIRTPMVVHMLSSFYCNNHVKSFLVITSEIDETYTTAFQGGFSKSINYKK